MNKKIILFLLIIILVLTILLIIQIKNVYAEDIIIRVISEYSKRHYSVEGTNNHVTYTIYNSVGEDPVKIVFTYKLIDNKVSEITLDAHHQNYSSAKEKMKQKEDGSFSSRTINGTVVSYHVTKRENDETFGLDKDALIKRIVEVDNRNYTRLYF